MDFFSLREIEELAFIHGQKRGQESRMKFLNFERERIEFLEI